MTQRLEPEHIENQTFPLSRRGYNREKVDAFLQVVAAYYREAIRQAEVRAQAQQSPGRPFEQLGDQVTAVLSTAARTAEDLTLSAEREVQRMKKAAAAEAAEITQAATDQLAAARQMKAEAQREAETMLAEARDEATRLRQDAHTVAARLEQNARDRATKLEQAANAKVASVLADARRRHENLRRTSQQAADHLRAVESALHRTAEELSGDRVQIPIPDLAIDDLEPEVTTAAEPAPGPVNGGAATASAQEMIADVLEPQLTKRPRPPNGRGARPPGSR